MVQGEKAAAQIVEAINKANKRKECDVLMLARGGGSLEYLWPFNEEKITRAIFSCQIPIVSGIGHEVNFTIADFTADQRAATPSAAAEKVSPNRIEWLQHIQTFQRRLSHLITTQLRHCRLQLQPIMAHLQRQNQRLEARCRRIESLHHRLIMAMDYHLNRRQQWLATKPKHFKR
ncbi:exodeoxyribonuclease VII large subunit [Candidatus Coxiella mudrowiae]|uniref:exodeoxyribonuclease VII large subunit n=1 Tax=Candidatus Coxiella mudrowiae TaxID=2054173 RepID=UPI0027D2AF1D|nr:exodeoxyribonuclease VII large subunit [Candidatus Coxiella mudrowiae]